MLPSRGTRCDVVPRCLARLSWLLGDIDDVTALDHPVNRAAAEERVSRTTDLGLPLNAHAMEA